MTDTCQDDASRRRRDAVGQAIGFGIIAVVSAVAVISVLMSGRAKDPVLMGGMLSFGLMIPMSLHAARTAAIHAARLGRSSR